ncbi:hypothetical protein ACUTFK_29150, partial [Klebsiella pneumoniae]
LMMSLWDALRMNMMISYQELVRTFLNAGHIYSVMTYMWMFATSLDDAPQLLEKFSQLRDIGKRVSTDDETSLSGKPC